MEPIKKDCYQCTKCDHAYFSERKANNCCLCTDCGKPRNTTSSLSCDDCRNKNSAKSYHSRIEKMETVDWKKDMVLTDDNDNYFFDDDDLYCRLENLDDDEMPDFLFVCDSTKLEIDADDVLERELEEHFEDACDHVIDAEGLRNYINSWCEKQTIKSWQGSGKQKVDVQSIVAEFKKTNPDYRKEISQ